MTSKKYRFIGYYKEYMLIKKVETGEIYYRKYEEEPFPPETKESDIRPIYDLTEKEQEEIFLLYED